MDNRTIDPAHGSNAISRPSVSYRAKDSRRSAPFRVDEDMRAAERICLHIAEVQADKLHNQRAKGSRFGVELESG